MDRQIVCAAFLFAVAAQAQPFQFPTANHALFEKGGEERFFVGSARYEIALNFNGVAFELILRAASEIKGNAKFQLLSVNEAEHNKSPARRLVAKRGSGWELAPHGLNLLDLLTY